jgi:hypothetical protein
MAEIGESEEGPVSGVLAGLVARTGENLSNMSKDEVQLPLMTTNSAFVSLHMP